MTDGLPAVALAKVGPVLVTGAAGFAGSHLLEHLSALGEVTGWSRSAPPTEPATAARWQRVDLLARHTVRAALRELRPAVVYHCAGVPHVAQSWKASAAALEGNVIGTHVLLDELRRLGQPVRCLITGSATVYAATDDPIDEDARLAPASPYALSKLAQEALALRAPQEDGIEVVVARAFNHTGPRQDPAFAAPSFARQIALIERGAIEPVIRVGNLEPRRDFTDVRDVVAAYVAALDGAETGEAYNVCTGVGHTVREMLETLIELSGSSVAIKVVPERVRKTDVPSVIGSFEKLHARTGWAPRRAWRETLADVLAEQRALAKQR
jgi:GDP-4-dehydro-6-deoxy-D-mannose reductase